LIARGRQVKAINCAGYRATGLLYYAVANVSYQIPLITTKDQT